LRRRSDFDALPFGRLCTATGRISNAIGYNIAAVHVAVIRVYDEAGNGLDGDPLPGQDSNPTLAVTMIIRIGMSPKVAMIIRTPRRVPSLDGFLFFGSP
jgi:hypothetical protein